MSRIRHLLGFLQFLLCPQPKFQVTVGWAAVVLPKFSCALLDRSIRPSLSQATLQALLQLLSKLNQALIGGLVADNRSEPVRTLDFFASVPEDL